MANPPITNSQEEEEVETCFENDEGVDDLDLPIAKRKGVRTCTKHTISNYLTYSKISRDFKAFITKVFAIRVPKDIYEALQDPKWKEVVLEEMKALNEN